MTDVVQFCFRTSYAGCDVGDKVVKAAQKIFKNHRMFNEGSGDKAAYFSMDRDHFFRLMRDLKSADLDSYIEIEGVDYNVSR